MKYAITVLLSLGSTLSYANKSTKQPIVDSVMVGTASYYHDRFVGRKTANGEIFVQTKLTAACNKYPLGTMLRVTRMDNGKSIVVKVNDRIHPRMKRIVDLTRKGAKSLNFIKDGLAAVKVEVI